MRSHLRKILSKRFTKEEIIALCFDLNLNYEDLSGDSKNIKCISLISYFENRRSLPTLIEAIKELRPDITLDSSRIQDEKDNGGVKDLGEASSNISITGNQNIIGSKNTVNYNSAE